MQLFVSASRRDAQQWVRNKFRNVGTNKFRNVGTQQIS